MNQTEVKENIIELLKTQNEHYAQLLANENTDLEEVPAPFLKEYKIYKAEYFLPHKSVIFFIGYKHHKDAIDLTGQPDRFMEMVQRDNLIIHSEELASDYAKVFFEVTRDRSSLSYIVEALNDIKFKPNLSEEEEALKQQFLNEFSKIIHPFEIQKMDNNSYLINFFVVTNQQLEKYIYKIQEKGSITVDKKIIATDMPTVYGL